MNMEGGMGRLITNHLIRHSQMILLMKTLLAIILNHHSKLEDRHQKIEKRGRINIM
jgi:hypothetical protein